MKQATGPRRKSRSGAKGNTPKDRTWYIALHETNFALSLGSGFIGPRFEKAAAVDVHTVAGRAIVCERAELADLPGARGDLAYGSVVLAEIDVGKLVSSGTAVSEAPTHIPVSAVRRVLFPSQSALDDFRARVSGFGDVPMELVPMLASPEPFGAGENGSPPEKSNADEAGVKYAIRLDALAGAIAGMLGAVRQLSWLPGLEVLRAVVCDQSVARDGGDFVTSLAAVLDPAKQDEKMRSALIAGTAKAVETSRGAEGFDPNVFIAAVREQCADAATNGAGKLDKLFKAAEEIAGLRRDLSANAYEDADGAVVQRAFLLFLLNPDVEKLFGASGRIKNLGQRVFVLACALAGYRAGISRTPREVKAPTNDAFIGMVNSAWRLAVAMPVAANIDSSWSDNGKRHSELSLEGYSVLALDGQPDQAVSKILAAIEEAGYKPTIAPASGQISFRGTNAGDENEIFASPDELPAFPVQPCFRLWTLSPPLKAAREVSEAVATAYSVERPKALLRQLMVGKQRRIEWRVYCSLPISAASVSHAVAALHAAMTTGTKTAADATPAQADIFGSGK